VDLMGTSHLESYGDIAKASNKNNFNSFIGLNYALADGFDDSNHDGFGDRINLDRYTLFTKMKLASENGKQFNLSFKWLYEDRRNVVGDFFTTRAYRLLRRNDAIYGESIKRYSGEVFGSFDLMKDKSLKLDYSLSHHNQNSFYVSDF
jgi:outer membrane receptor for ferrienterochelin and colicins